MIFLDPWFWMFAGVAIPGYWILPVRAKSLWLLAASLVFHWYFAGPAGMFPIVLLGFLTYVAGLSVARPNGRIRFLLTCGCLVGALAFYKYAEFVFETVADLARTAEASGLAVWLETWRAPAAPLAISFFTFEFVHYLYEVRVGGRSPIRNPIHFTLFAVFFPTLASGPIKRFPDFVPQLQRPTNPSPLAALMGAERVIRGLFKKICVADLLVEPIRVLESSETFTAPLLLALAVLQGFRIYYDFAGYSDIAIGLAAMLGLRVPENFDRPYFSTSLQQFWRRWHMSLSSWIRDYVYVPMGGNRGRRGLHLLVAMALCGLWHGAAWNFVLWGVYHGAGLVLEAGARRRWPGIFRAGRLRSGLGWLVCYGYVSYGWLLFFYPLDVVIDMTREALQWLLGS
jgi:alginate O-acetyltransferase complex protein AlgI